MSACRASKTYYYMVAVTVHCSWEYGHTEQVIRRSLNHAAKSLSLWPGWRPAYGRLSQRLYKSLAKSASN